MRQKRKSLMDHDRAVAIVRAFHVERRTQMAIAREHGISHTYVNHIVHGQRFPEAYKQVARELGDAA